MRKYNWFGVAGGGVVLLLIAVSLLAPWWQLRVGEDLVKVNASPLNTNFNFVGNAFIIPLIFALNVASILSLLIGGVTILVYAFRPSKPYSARLLAFAYRKPVYAVGFFLLSLIAVVVLVKAAFRIDVPLIGTVKAELPPDMASGVSVSILMSAEFQWPFWLAIAAATLCIAARLYHKKVASPQREETPENVEGKAMT
jgi:hypothetical protein